MYTVGRHRRWSVIPLLIAALLALGSTTAVLADATTSPVLVPSCETERGRPPDRDPPPGQMARRGIIGDVVRTIEDRGTLVAIVVGTQFGTVEIGIPEDLDTDAGVGDRVAVLTVKEPKPPVGSTPPDKGGTDTPFTIEVEEGETDTPFRTTVAKKITIIPNTASLSHSRGVIQSQGDATTEVIDDEGNVDEFETTDEGGVQVPPDEDDGDSGGTGEGEGDEEPPVVEEEIISSGTDVILLIQCSGSSSDPVIRSILQAARIAARMERLQARFADNPDRLAKFQELQEAQEERLQARLDRTASNAPPGAQGSVGKAQRQARGECEGDPDSDLCPDDRSKGKGKSQGSNDGDSGGGGGAGRGQGGGNQGGGGQGNNDKGPPEDKGKK